MMFKLDGIDRETALETTFYVEASSLAIAQAVAEAKGIIVVDTVGQIRPELHSGRGFNTIVKAREDTIFFFAVVILATILMLGVIGLIAHYSKG